MRHLVTLAVCKTVTVIDKERTTRARSKCCDAYHQEEDIRRKFWHVVRISHKALGLQCKIVVVVIYCNTDWKTDISDNGEPKASPSSIQQLFIANICRLEKNVSILYEQFQHVTIYLVPIKFVVDSVSLIYVCVSHVWLSRLCTGNILILTDT